MSKQLLPLVVAAASTLLLSHASLAGGMAEPVMEDEVIAAEAAASDAGILVPILFLIFTAAALSNDG